MTPAPAWRRHWPLTVLAGGALLALLWSTLAPLRGGSHELLLEIAPGSRQSAVRLTLGVQDVLLLRNATGKPLVFGPVQLAPGAAFRLPVEEAGEQDIPCPVLPGGMLRVRTVPIPDPGLERLRWRLANFGNAIRTMPLKAPDA
ncbi:hypothetical protein [Telluria aromaticivorans]|uniref:Uncharacterized protein n=1 Tax=Telluria aromaticivorans TaxID=2725995 RepID=A0A7Y2JXU8_9BURK|nr:hypothetical protein [Telluria aromaticivorans]NNG22955.1 hypothetical protein [Telluria aromaticivorans]